MIVLLFISALHDYMSVMLHNIFYLKGFNFQPPPLLPRNHIERHGLLKRMVDALVQKKH